MALRKKHSVQPWTDVPYSRGWAWSGSPCHTYPPWQSLPLLGFFGHFFTMLRMPTPCIWVFGTTHWIIERPVSSLSRELDQVEKGERCARWE